MFARLKPGYTVESARASLQPLFHQIPRQEAGEPALRMISSRDRDMFLKRSALVEIAANGHSGLRRQYSTALIVLMCMAGLVLVDRVLECGKPADRARSRDRKKWRCAWRSARGGRR